MFKSTYFLHLFSSGSGECLLDKPPIRDFSFPEETPGQMYDAEEQCRFQHGPQSRQCNIGVSRVISCLQLFQHKIFYDILSSFNTMHKQKILFYSL